MQSGCASWSVLPNGAVNAPPGSGLGSRSQGVPDVRRGLLALRVVPPPGYGYCFTYIKNWGPRMRRLKFLPFALLLTACAHAPVQTGAPRWTYIGNDPEGTQNISMLPQSSDKKN